MNTYCGPPPAPMDWLQQWNFDPVVIIGLGLLLFAGGRVLPAAGGEPRARVSAVAVLALLFLSPLCGLTTALFSARAIHHLLLVAVAAPLLALAWPCRRPLGPGLPLVAATLAFWAWHAPQLYALALADSAVYWVMQLTLLTSAVVFWRAIFSPNDAGVGLVAVLIAAAQMGLLGALLVFAPAPLYAPHLASTLPWGIGPLADQQLAGLLMWVPGILPYGVAAAILSRRDWRAAAA
jgi:putative membrane protein